MADPNAQFVVTHVTRGSIAENLNDYYENYTGNHGQLTADDDRLTDEICRQFATFLGNLDTSDMSPNAKDEAEQEMFYGILESISLL